MPRSSGSGSTKLRDGVDNKIIMVHYLQEGGGVLAQSNLIFFMKVVSELAKLQ